MRRTALMVAASLSLLVTWNLVAAQNGQTLRYSVVFSDSQDVTHFRDEQLPWQVPPNYYGGASATPFLDAQKIGFLHLPRGFRSDWHPAPSKRFVMVLSGVVEVEVSDGQRRKFSPGSVNLVTDTGGRGHRTNVLGSDDVLLAWVPVP
jgi:hypothetical protein